MGAEFKNLTEEELCDMMCGISEGEETYITRNEAVDTLYMLVNSDILDDDLRDKIEEIANCIEKENLGYSLWGAEEDATELFVARREDLWTDELKERLAEIHNKYSFTPAPFERADFEERLSED